MHFRSFTFVALLVACTTHFLSGPARAAEGAEDPIAQNFFTPDLIQQSAEAIGISDQQRQELMSAVSSMQEKMNGLREQMEHQRDELAEAVKGEKIDSDKALEAADGMMKLESQVKRLQLQMLIKIKNSLTPEQQAKLREMRGKVSGAQSKMRELVAEAHKLHEQGADMAPLEQVRGQVQELMHSGKADEAAALLEKTLQEIKQKAPAK